MIIFQLVNKTSLIILFLGMLMYGSIDYIILGICHLDTVD